MLEMTSVHSCSPQPTKRCAASVQKNCFLALSIIAHAWHSSRTSTGGFPVIGSEPLRTRSICWQLVCVCTERLSEVIVLELVGLAMLCVAFEPVFLFLTWLRLACVISALLCMLDARVKRLGCHFSLFFLLWSRLRALCVNKHWSSCRLRCACLLPHYCCHMHRAGLCWACPREIEHACPDDICNLDKKNL